ncbi:MAG TPA: phage portal protein [Candidatus Acidoferrales bacterium]|nr:phage portal protein [Candidatus Acidoferrales bacterium]
MARKVIFTDGRKSAAINIGDDNDHPEAWNWLSGDPRAGIEMTASDYFAKVPWLYRGVRLVASTVGSIPFEIKNLKGDLVEESSDYRNKVGFLPNPKRLLYLIAAARMLTGRAYVFNNANKYDVTKSLKYLNPLSVDPLYFKEGPKVGDLRAWNRRMTGPGSTVVEKEFKLEEIAYFWLADPYSEIGPPANYPVRAALSAAGVLFNVDLFATGFFGRGAIKATLLLVGDKTKKDERDKFEAWWNKFYRGIANAFQQKVFNADQVQVVTIGEGLEGLEDSDLTDKKREDISQALGIPQSKLFSNDAGGLGGGGVVQQDDIRFYTETIIPETREIFDAFNEQVFGPNGYQIEVNEGGIDVYQEDEKERSFALYNMVTAIAASPEAAEFSMHVLGYELSDDDKLALAAIREEKARQAELAQERFERFGDPAQGNNAKEPERAPRPKMDPNAKAQLEDALKELGQWQRNAARLGGAKSAAEFVAERLPAEFADLVRIGLSRAVDKEAIKAVFVGGRQLLESGHFDAALVGAVKGALEKGAEPARVYAALGGWESYP